MICRVWRGWTTPENAQSYDDYLQKELFPRLERELHPHGFRGYQLLRLNGIRETEFMTMLYFDSLAQVQAFAGENYETPVISAKARTLLSRFAERADHYDLSGSQLPADLHKLVAR